MANTIHGPFVPGAATSAGSYGTGVGQSNTYTSGNANNDETQSAVALHSLNPHLISAGFVLSGATCTKDGVNANQIDIASGVAFLIQSDGTLAQCDIAADNTHITSGATATWHLYLQPDGTWYWNTANAPATNSLFIAQVVTDASGNINTVTDERPLNVELLTAMAANGSALIDIMGLGILAPDLGAGKRASLGHLDGTNGAFSNAFFFNTPMVGASPQGYYWASWDGGATKIPFSVGGSFGNALAWIGANGQLGALGGQASVGSFGVPVIVAQAMAVHVTSTALQNILTFTPAATGFYRFNISFSWHNTSNSTLFANVQATDPHIGAVTMHFSEAGNNLFGFSVIAGTTAYSPQPMVYYCAGGSAITLQFQDTAGAPDDYVSAMIERLS